MYVNGRFRTFIYCLFFRYGVTKWELLEKLLVAEEEKVLKDLDLDSDEGRKYLGGSYAGLS
jgi:hypothetical protein